MADVTADDRGPREEWAPAKRPEPAPMFSRPTRLGPILKFFFGAEGFLWPKNLLYFGVAALSWGLLTRFGAQPDRFAALGFGWIGELYVHNALMMLAFAGLPHLRLYIRRAQGRRFKYHPSWLSTRNRAFMFGNQTLDNLFLTLVPGVLIWTGFQALLLWGYANGALPAVTWSTQPVYSVLLVILILFWRSLHFYWIHRLIHWKPLYRAFHYIHHKNVNIGPWSGIAMHPVEQAIYFSVVLLILVVPSHPLHMFFILVHAGLAAATDHSGFDRIEVGEQRTVGHGSYFHYLHHRYFDCNYGGPTLPLDDWFGSFHDGTAEAHTVMRQRQRKLKADRRDKSPGM